MNLFHFSTTKVLGLCCGLILLFSSCYKVTHNAILKGEFHLNSFEINGGSTNFMGGVLPNYVDENDETNIIGDYVIYMLDNGLMRGEYYSDGELVYYRTGEWDMPTKDSIYMKIDVFVDGTFYIEQISTKEMLMSTDKNNISFFNIGEVASTLRISNGEKMDPDSTKP
ncbi:MAG: hypothetical protein N4A35_00345 [Flavobacteriales bacterium]|jgi:hypothetical protein|nr:hypothetical protein [Flavobacteriales bacterium]